MRTKISNIFMLFAVVVFFAACNGNETKNEEQKELTEMEKLVDTYAEVELTADLSHLSDNQKEMIKKLIEVADIMEELFWKDAIGDKATFLATIEDEATKQYAMINYGPWDKMNGDEPFIEGYGVKPAGANYYPQDITAEEFEAFNNLNKNSWYTLLRRNEEGNLKCVWYHEEYAEEIEKAAILLEEAAELAEDEGFKKYLQLRATALRTDEYLASDLAWMDMKDNLIDFVVGPIESYEDGFKGLKAAHSGQILVKDLVWSKNISKFTSFLPALQESLPIADTYKYADQKHAEEDESPKGDMNVYYVIYYGGDCNKAGKNIAINLPNDPRVHSQKGSRKLQLKNAMQAKFDKILVPIANMLIDESQLKHVKFEVGFFQNVMFHEVAHGLGIKYTVDGSSSVRDALEDYYSPLEEAKADIAGLYMVTKLYEMGEFPEKDLMDNYVTFLAGIFRSVRFGTASSHGKANMLEFYYLQEKGAFTRDAETGRYSVNLDIMKEAVETLVNEIIIIQGDGNKAAAKEWIDSKGVVGEELQKDLDRVGEAGIPKDIVFNQGVEVLGL